MAIDMTKMTSKGQIVIPQGIREEARIKEGERFMIFNLGNNIYIKRMDVLEKSKDLEEFRKTLESFWADNPQLRKISEKDIEEEIKAVREEKRNAKANA